MLLQLFASKKGAVKGAAQVKKPS